MTNPTDNQPLDKANQLISELVNALDVVRRSETLAGAQGAAAYALELAERARTRNTDGYLVIQ